MELQKSVKIKLHSAAPWQAPAGFAVMKTAV